MNSNSLAPTSSEYPDMNNQNAICSSLINGAFVIQMISKKLLFAFSRTKNSSMDRKTIRTPISSTTDLQELILTGNNIVVNLENAGILGLNIQSLPIGQALSRLLRDLGVNCYITVSPKKGYHLFFNSEGTNIDLSKFKNGLRTLPLGCVGKFFIRGDLVLLGPNYFPVILPQDKVLGSIPSFLIPLSASRESKWAREQARICDDQLIPGENRNTTLLAYLNIMSKHTNVYSCRDPDSRLLWLIARYFCDPPYEDNIDHFNEWLRDQLPCSGMKVYNQSNEVSAPAIIDRLGRQAILYAEVDNQWYVGDQESQLWKPVTEFEVCKILCNVASEINYKPLSVTAMRNLIEVLKTSCLYSGSDFETAEGLAFEDPWADIWNNLEFKYNILARYKDWML